LNSTVNYNYLVAEEVDMNSLNWKKIFDGTNLKGCRRFISEYDFYLGKLPQRITIRLYQLPDRDEVEFVQSHFIHTPTQADAYRTSTPYGDDELGALERAVRDLTMYYDSAVADGHVPNEAWLEANPQFFSLRP
jgi:hypothetical protein